MSRDGAKNPCVAVAAVVVMAPPFTLMRARPFVGDAAWKRALISRSIAILTRGNMIITDPEARLPADGIFHARREEIAQLKALPERLVRHPG